MGFGKEQIHNFIVIKNGQPVFRISTQSNGGKFLLYPQNRMHLSHEVENLQGTSHLIGEYIRFRNNDRIQIKKTDPA